MVYATPHLGHPVLFIPISFSKGMCSAALLKAIYIQAPILYIHYSQSLVQT